jgi:hypothetical protein
VELTKSPGTSRRGSEGIFFSAFDITRRLTHAKGFSKQKVQSPTLLPYGERKEPILISHEQDFIERSNIAWRVEPGEQDPDPPLEPKYPWDSACVFLHGASWWTRWTLKAGTSRRGRRQRISAGRILTYAESEDGVRWIRPELDIATREGHARSNILLDLDSGGLSQHPSVLVHPDADPDWRYEMFVLRYPGFAGSAEVVRGFPLPPGETKHSGGVYRYHSSDGKHWQPWEQLGLSTRDSILVHQLPDNHRTFCKGVAPVPPVA